MDRNLDGYYFRLKRNDKWDNVCFSDLSEEEMLEVLNNRSEEWLKSLCVGLGQTIKYIGNKFGLEG